MASSQLSSIRIRTTDSSATSSYPTDRRQSADTCNHVFCSCSLHSRLGYLHLEPPRRARKCRKCVPCCITSYNAGLFVHDTLSISQCRVCMRSCNTAAGHISLHDCRCMRIASAATAAHGASLSCVCLQDLVKMERAVWTARLHEKLCEELAYFSFEGTRIDINHTDLSSWVQVIVSAMLPMHYTILHGNTYTVTVRRGGINTSDLSVPYHGCISCLHIIDATVWCISLNCLLIVSFACLAVCYLNCLCLDDVAH